MRQRPVVVRRLLVADALTGPVDDDDAVAGDGEDAPDVGITGEHALELDRRHVRGVHVQERHAEALRDRHEVALVRLDRAAGEQQAAEVQAAQLLVVAEAAAAEDDAAAGTHAHVAVRRPCPHADNLTGLVAEDTVDAVPGADVDPALQRGGLHLPRELDAAAGLAARQPGQDDPAEPDAVDGVVAVVVRILRRVDELERPHLLERLQRRGAVVVEGLEELVLPLRQAERRMAGVVESGPREAGEVVERVLARVLRPLLAHEAVVRHPGPGGRLVAGAPDPVRALEQHGLETELGGVHRDAEPGHRRAHDHHVRLDVPRGLLVQSLDHRLHALIASSPARRSGPALTCPGPDSSFPGRSA
jgi:hypothetical protein